MFWYGSKRKPIFIRAFGYKMLVPFSDDEVDTDTYKYGIRCVVTWCVCMYICASCWMWLGYVYSCSAQWKFCRHRKYRFAHNFSEYYHKLNFRNRTTKNWFSLFLIFNFSEGMPYCFCHWVLCAISSLLYTYITQYTHIMHVIKCSLFFPLFVEIEPFCYDLQKDYLVKLKHINLTLFKWNKMHGLLLVPPTRALDREDMPKTSVPFLCNNNAQHMCVHQLCIFLWCCLVFYWKRNTQVQTLQ